MDVYLSWFRLINMQSHVDTIVDLPAKGIVRFIGGNSNGKSVFVKVVGKLIKNRLHITRERNALIRRGCEAGILYLGRSDGMEMKIHLHREPSKTYVSLKIPNEEVELKRHVTTDKNIMELVRIFGLHVEESRKMSLNLYETFDPLWLVTTSGADNDAIVSSVITDNKAENAVTRMTEQHKGLKAITANIDTTITSQEAVLAAMRFVPEDSYREKASVLKYLSSNIALLATPNVKLVKFIPNIDNIEYMSMELLKESTKELNVKPVPDLSVINTLGVVDYELTDITYEVNSTSKLVQSYLEGKCDTCGRDFAEGGCH